MVTRRHATDYAGARGRLSLDAALALGPSHVLQPKIDGEYVRVHLDGSGRVAALYSRSGSPLPTSQVRDVLGARIGTPHAELVGELDAHTEAGNRAAEEYGARRVHLFDCIRAGRYLAREPYAVRYRALCSMQVWAASSSSRWQDEEHGVRNVESGRWSRDVLGEAGLERCPVVPFLSRQDARRAWERAMAGEAEGLVACALSARLGARGSKRKVKPAETLDCRVVSTDGKAARVAAGSLSFVVAARGLDVEPGAWVEVRFEGWYQRSNSPRFARVVRVREDLRV